MKYIITIILLFTSFAFEPHLIGIGLDNKKIFLWEYWKVDNNIASEEFIIFNPQPINISVAFIKVKKIHNELKNDTILFIPKITAKDYLIVNKSLGSLLSSQTYFDVVVNNEKAGKYSPQIKCKSPTLDIEEGIVTKKRPNTGSVLPIELYYNKLDYSNEKIDGSIIYLSSDFFESGFSKSKNEKTKIKIIDYYNLLSKDTEYNHFTFESIGLNGCIDVEFQSKLNREIIENVGFRHFAAKGIGSHFPIPIPFDVNFCDESKYLEK